MVPADIEGATPCHRQAVLAVFNPSMPVAAQAWMPPGTNGGSPCKLGACTEGPATRHKQGKHSLVPVSCGTLPWTPLFHPRHVGLTCCALPKRALTSSPAHSLPCLSFLHRPDKLLLLGTPSHTQPTQTPKPPPLPHVFIPPRFPDIVFIPAHIPQVCCAPTGHTTPRQRGSSWTPLPASCHQTRSESEPNGPSSFNAASTGWRLA